jgi:hypothetical protein
MASPNVPDDDFDTILRSLDGLQRATPRPFFTTRTEARLDSRLQASAPLLGWAFRPLTVGVSMALILLLNLSAIGLYQSQIAPESTPDLFAADWQSDDFFSW